MKAVINGKPAEFASTPTLADVIRAAGVSDTRGVAVAVNEEVVPKEHWETTKVAEGDTVEVVRAVQGG